MNSILILTHLLVAVFVGIVAFWFASIINKPTIKAKGLLEFQDKEALHISASPPQGYYIKSNAFDRVYVSYSRIADYVNQEVVVIGKVKAIKGREGRPYYPLIQANDIQVME